MAVATNSFDSWLSKKLQALNTDESVFGSYIKGILEGDETEDEKTEALESILAGITEDNINKHVTEILSAWAEWTPIEETANTTVPTEDVDVRLARMLESQNLPTTTQRSYTEEERQIREAVLAQYRQMFDEEDSEGEGEEDGDYGIEKNLNPGSIQQEEKERRGKTKLKSRRHREKEKDEREKHKQSKDERREKAKEEKVARL